MLILQEPAERRESTLVRKKKVRSPKQQNGGKLSCHCCGGGYATNFTLRRHLKKKTRSYKCEVCEKGHEEKAQLKRHMLYHTQGKPHSCRCGKKFADKENFKRHQEKAHPMEFPSKKRKRK